jgi:hypothetical protein
MNLIFYAKNRKISAKTNIVLLELLHLDLKMIIYKRNIYEILVK